MPELRRVHVVALADVGQGRGVDADRDVVDVREVRVLDAEAHERVPGGLAERVERRPPDQHPVVVEDDGVVHASLCVADGQKGFTPRGIGRPSAGRSDPHRPNSRTNSPASSATVPAITPTNGIGTGSGITISATPSAISAVESFTADHRPRRGNTFREIPTVGRRVRADATTPALSIPGPSKTQNGP
ncbi:hypothetical protein BN903_20 [Halorubrum sp. AJ67]|nr:hypothetical protein BN903_20 [Halorubrum sp. AJ67]